MTTASSVFILSSQSDVLRRQNRNGPPTAPRSYSKRTPAATRGARPVGGARGGAGRASSGVQMLILRVSGIRNRASTNMIAGNPMGYASAQPRLPVDRYAEVVMIGTRPPPQPLPM